MMAIYLFFENLNVTEILGIGISGFAFLLVLMAFYLIFQEQKREGEPRKGIMKMIYNFMLINVGVMIFVGFLGLKNIGENKKLTEENSNLEQKTTDLERWKEKEIVADTISILVHEENPNNQKIDYIIQSYKTKLDSIALQEQEKELNERISKSKNILTELKDSTVSIKRKEVLIRDLKKISFAIDKSQSKRKPKN